jgi:hypothetical protein
MIRGAQAWLARPIDEHRDHLARLERRVDAGLDGVLEEHAFSILLTTAV